MQGQGVKGIHIQKQGGENYLDCGTMTKNASYRNIIRSIIIGHCWDSALWSSFAKYRMCWWAKYNQREMVLARLIRIACNAPLPLMEWYNTITIRDSVMMWKPVLHACIVCICTYGPNYTKRKPVAERRSWTCCMFSGNNLNLASFHFSSLTDRQIHWQQTAPSVTSLVFPPPISF